jgi:hypothetical protein
MIGGGEDEIGAFVVEIFGEKFVWASLRGVGRRWACGGLGGILHC